MDTTIREYDAETDEADLRECFIALQDHEHELLPEAPTGEELVEIYVPFMLERVVNSGGATFVAISDGRVVGFVTAIVVPREEPDDIDDFHVEIAELSVLPNERGHGVGSRLIETAEELARDRGAPSTRIRVDARNVDARRLYERRSYEAKTITLIKRRT